MAGAYASVASDIILILPDSNFAFFLAGQPGFRRRQAPFIGPFPSRGRFAAGAPEWDDLSSNRHPILIYRLSMIPRVEPEGMLFLIMLAGDRRISADGRREEVTPRSADRFG
jgi:hypothetical protein